jgi:hypothetical protein
LKHKKTKENKNNAISCEYPGDCSFDNGRFLASSLHSEVDI